MILIQKIGNSFHPSIELEADYLSRHEDGKLPILDLKVWVEMRRKQSGGKEVNEVNVVQNRSCAISNESLPLDASGEQPLYRPTEWKRLERA